MSVNIIRNLSEFLEFFFCLHWKLLWKNETFQNVVGIAPCRKYLFQFSLNIQKRVRVSSINNIVGLLIDDLFIDYRQNPQKYSQPSVLKAKPPAENKTQKFYVRKTMTNRC